MGLTVTTDLSPADLAKALISAFPGEGITVRRGADEGDLDVTFENPARDSSDADAAIAAWSSGDLARAKVAAVAALQARRDHALAAWAYTLGEDTYAVPITSELKTDVQVTLTGLGAAPEGTTIDWEIEDGTYLTWGGAELLAFGQAAFAFAQACFANSKAITDTIKAASTPEAAAAVDLETGWPEP